MTSNLAFVVLFTLLPYSAIQHRVTAEKLDKVLGPGMKHVSCHIRVTGFYIKRHCKKHLHSSLRCDLDEKDRRKVRKVAKMCCEDADSCEPHSMFNDFCCQGEQCQSNVENCQPWDDAVEEIELANLIYSSDELFDDIQNGIIEQVHKGISPDYWPAKLRHELSNYKDAEQDIVMRKYFKKHRLHTAYIAKSLQLIDGDNRINF